MSLHPVPFQTSYGQPQPYGAHLHEGGVNFALFSQNATSVTLCLFPPQQQGHYEIELDPVRNRTGNIWHIFLHHLSANYAYGYRIDGPYDTEKGQRFNRNCIVLDPYAKRMQSPIDWQVKGQQAEPLANYAPRGLIPLPSSFDWQGTLRPRHHLKDLVIYEMHVRGFTQHPSSKVKHPGSFLGVIEKIPYLKRLGVNAVELLPIHEFNEAEYLRKNPETNAPLCNYWGYSTVNFFCPMNRYGTKDGQSTAEEFKLMVRELHKHGIEVILDVVFNHTAEGNEHGPTLSFKGIDNEVYYLLGTKGHYLNYSGCGNTLHTNHLVTQQMVLDSLRYWVAEMHVDGFRFDLASILTRGSKIGEFLSSASLIEAISGDPLLADTKLIAEPWDATMEGYMVGRFYPEKGWAEWNGKYRDDARSFLKGDNSSAGKFGDCISGSKELYGHLRAPFHSINFITAHDGFSLMDLVSYNGKHNLANAEENHDGTNDNKSWNCGIEGGTQLDAVLSLRQRQMRNHLLALLLSRGVPMLLMGDEYGHTRKGNNNTWCQDNELNWFLWDEWQKQEKGLFRFTQKLIQFRHEHPLLRQESFLEPGKVSWHGNHPYHPDWSAGSKLVAFTLHDQINGNDLYIAFNASHQKHVIHLPSDVSKFNRKKWHRIVDTSLAAPLDIADPGEERIASQTSCHLEAYSAIMLKWK